MDNHELFMISECECFDEYESEILFSAGGPIIWVLFSNVSMWMSFRKYCALYAQQVDTVSVIANTGSYPKYSGSSQAFNWVSPGLHLNVSIQINSYRYAELSVELLCNYPTCILMDYSAM
jgi:hypothetical protein